jgi:hypothetical protein
MNFSEMELNRMEKVLDEKGVKQTKHSRTGK